MSQLVPIGAVNTISSREFIRRDTVRTPEAEVPFWVWQECCLEQNLITKNTRLHSVRIMPLRYHPIKQFFRSAPGDARNFRLAHSVGRPRPPRKGRFDARTSNPDQGPEHALACAIRTLTAPAIYTKDADCLAPSRAPCKRKYARSTATCVDQARQKQNSLLAPATG